MPVDANIDTTDLPLIDPNTGPLKMAVEDKRITLYTKAIIDLDKPCRIKYHPLTFNRCSVWVTGRLTKNYRCHVAIDTGCWALGALSWSVIRENKLPIYPIEIEEKVFDGFCYLPVLQVGEAKIREVGCLCMNKELDRQFFGMPVNRIRRVLLGLQLLKEFRYILVDGVHKELMLSAEQSFTPMQDDQWLQYPLKIEEYPKGGLRLMIDIPIGGKTYHIQLDTGSDGALTVDTKFFDELSKSITATVKKRKGKDLFLIGWVDCQKVVLPELDFCHRILKNAQISILPDDMAGKYTNLVGMQCFKDTVMVLDFERELMWVKQHN